MITAEQMMALFLRHPYEGLLVSEINTNQFAVRNEDDGGRVDYIFVYNPHCFVDEKGEVCYELEQKVLRCSYNNLKGYPKNFTEETIDDSAGVQDAMQDVLQRIQKKSSELSALGGAGVSFATLANYSNPSKSQLQNQDSVVAGLLEGGDKGQDVLRSVFESMHQKYGEALGQNQSFQNSGAAVAGLVFDPKTKVVDVASLGDVEVLAFGRFSDDSKAIVRIAKPVNGEEKTFRDKVIENAKAKGYKYQDQGFLSNFEKEGGDKKFSIDRNGRINWRSEGGDKKSRSLAMLGAVGDNDFGDLLIREPYLRSFCGSDCKIDLSDGSEAELEIEFLAVVSDGVGSFLEKASNRYHVFELSIFSGEYMLMNEDDDKSDLYGKWPSFERIFNTMADDLRGDDDVTGVFLDVKNSNLRRKILLVADGHGAMGGHVAHLCSARVRGNYSVEVPRALANPEIDDTKKILIWHFLSSEARELHFFQKNFFSDLDLSGSYRFMEVQDFLSEHYEEDVAKVFAIRSGLQERIYKKFADIEEKLQEILGADKPLSEECFLKKDEKGELSFFVHDKVLIKVSDKGMFWDSEFLSACQQVEALKDVESRFKKLLLQQNSADTSKTDNPAGPAGAAGRGKDAQASQASAPDKSVAVKEAVRASVDAAKSDQLASQQPPSP